MKNNYKNQPTRNTMGKFLRNLVAIVMMVVGMNSAKASHMAGADLTYRYLGNNQYLVTYSFYRDCTGITPPTTETLQIYSSSCRDSSTAVLNQVAGTGNEISLNCPGVSSTCNGGTAPGIQRYVYTATITISRQCRDWRFSVSDCCRNLAITTLSGNGDLYIEAYLNNTVYSNNNSPTFSSVPVAYECIGQNNYYNHGVIDADGDSLVYSFITPRTAINTPVGYNAGYSISAPITSSPAVTINSHTGDIFMKPTQVEVGVIAVQILEYRNGLLIGSVMRDLQIYTTNCNNSLPALTGINGSNNFNTSSCGSQLCFNIVSTDNDPSQNLVMTWNNGIPNGTFSTSGGRLPVGTFCWTPTPADARPQPYQFTVTIRDNACPVIGSQTYSFNITVSAMTVNITSTPTVACNGDHTASGSATASGLAPLHYFWSNSNADTLSTTANVSNLGAGNYSLQVTDATGCVGTRNFTVTQPTALTATANSFSSSCNGAPSGSALATATGGTSPYTYIWNNNPSLNTATINNIGPGTYNVVVSDRNLCSTTASTTITAIVPPSFAISSTPTTCTGSSGTATVSVSNGSGQYHYLWNPNIASAASATGLAAGSYSVIITDLITGCSGSVTTTVGSISPTTFSMSSTPATCGGNTGTATVAVADGSGQYSYVWTPGVSSTQAATGLAPGNYQVQVTDNVTGCSGIVSTTVGNTSATLHPEILPAGPLSLCGGQTANLETISGANLTYVWFNGIDTISNNAGSLLVSGAGSYSVLITDENGCTGISNTVSVTAGSATQPTVTSSPTIGCEANTIYLGYGPQGVTLTASAPGAVSYLWSDGQTGSTITVTQAGNYSVIATDASGCVSQPSAGTQININVVDIRCGRNNRKILLCHVPPGNLSNPQTICVDSSAIPSHLALHAEDCLGPCSNAQRIIEEENSASIYPNPSYDIFTVVCRFNNLSGLRMTLQDVSGRIISSGDVSSETFEVGKDLTPGIYYINISGNGVNTTLRMIKVDAEH